MIADHPSFDIERWSFREVGLDLDILARTESLFALSNGHIGLRGNLDEGEPHGLSGSYLNAFYEIVPLPYAEPQYGVPEQGQVVVNVTDAKVIRLLVDDEPFDVRYGELRNHERTLDLRAGTLHRSVEWVSPAGKVVRVNSTRLVSFAQRAAAAICYEVEAVDSALHVVVQSELIANEPPPAGDGDPRAGSVLAAPLKSEWTGARDLAAVLAHSTIASGLLMAAGMDHTFEGPPGVETSAESMADEARVSFAASLAPGEHLRVVKFASYGWSAQRSLPAIRDQTVGACVAAKQTGWDGMLAEQRSYLDDFWGRCDVEIDGDLELQCAVRASLFHCLQASARAEGRAIPAKGLTGPGYDGHTFWDTEAFAMLALTYAVPAAVRDALRWRHSTLDLARERAATLGFKGAAFPWRTIRGQETSAYWPAGTAAFHVNADIANAIVRYAHATDDEDFVRDYGLEMLVETARLWRSLGHHDAKGRFRIDGVTGPDEYSAIADNNIYTNLMAQRNLRAAAEAAERYPAEAEALGVDPEETASWRDAAETVVIPRDEALGVHSQAEAFTQHERWDFEGTPADHYPLLLHYPYFDLYRKQVVKQSDLVLAMHLRGDAFTDEEKLRNFDYYEALTVRDSSLSACTQAVLAAEVGHIDLAYDYFGEAALIDLRDLEHNTGDGLHIASLAGAWIAAVAGLGGMRDHDGELSFRPRLPVLIERLAFGLTFRGRQLRVAVEPGHATYELRAGEPIEITHDGKRFQLTREKTVRRAIPAAPDVPAPRQPHGRAPDSRARYKQVKAARPASRRRR